MYYTHTHTYIEIEGDSRKRKEMEEMHYNTHCCLDSLCGPVPRFWFQVAKQKILLPVGRGNTMQLVHSYQCLGEE